MTLYVPMFSRTAAEADHQSWRGDIMKMRQFANASLFLAMFKRPRNCLLKLTRIKVDDGLLLVAVVWVVNVGGIGVLVDGVVHLEGERRDHNSERHCDRKPCI